MTTKAAAIAEDNLNKLVRKFIHSLEEEETADKIHEINFLSRLKGMRRKYKKEGFGEKETKSDNNHHQLVNLWLYPWPQITEWVFN